MKYYVSIGGNEFEIELSDRGEGLEGRFNGKRCRVDYAEIEEGAKYSVIVDGESFNVSVHHTEDGEDLIFAGHLFHAQVMDERERGARALEDARAVKGPQVVKSVMPGIVRKVFVAKGDEVKAGAPLLILEAMKMENELKSEKDGVVTKVHVAEGQTVNSSDPLVAID